MDVEHPRRSSVSWCSTQSSPGGGRGSTAANRETSALHEQGGIAVIKRPRLCSPRTAARRRHGGSGGGEPAPSPRAVHTRRNEPLHDLVRSRESGPQQVLDILHAEDRLLIEPLEHTMTNARCTPELIGDGAPMLFAQLEDAGRRWNWRASAFRADNQRIAVLRSQEPAAIGDRQTKRPAVCPISGHFRCECPLRVGRRPLQNANASQERRPVG